MNKVEDYMPRWLQTQIKKSVCKAVDNHDYEYWVDYWRKVGPLTVNYFSYYYFKEVITDYIKCYGEWGKEEDNAVNTERLVGG